MLFFPQFCGILCLRGMLGNYLCSLAGFGHRRMGEESPSTNPLKFSKGKFWRENGSG